MSGTQLNENEKKDNKLSSGKRPKLTEQKKSEYAEIIGGRAEPRELSGWDAHPLGRDGIPAVILRYKVYEEMRARNYKGRNAVAKIFGVSPGFVTKWTNILRAAYETGTGVKNACIALSTRPPHTIRSPVSDRIERDVLAVRETLSFMGPMKIERMYVAEGSAPTIGRIIKKYGLQHDHKPYKQRKYVRYERPCSMYMLQTDYKGWDEQIYSIWMMDDHSRFIPGFRVVASATAETVIELMEEVCEKYGRPIQVLTDHGVQFTTMHENGNHVFEEYLAQNNVKHIMGRVNHPQTQGKIERSHGSAIIEMEAVWGGKPKNIDEFREAIGAWVEFHNTFRVHQSLDYKTPAEVFLRDMKAMNDPAWIEAVRKEFPDGSRAY